MSSGIFKINADHLLESTDPKITVDTTTYVADKNQTPFNAGEAASIIIHYTAGRSGASSSKYMARPDVKASAHLVIDRKKGIIYQLVPFNIKSWHAGKSSYKDRKYYNNFSIGIEIDNAGPLTPAGSKFKSWFGAVYEPEEVVRAIHRNEKEPRYWHTYTEEQIDICEEIVSALVNHYQSMKVKKQVLGHEEISPGRKQDPGPAFPLDKLRDHVFSEDRALEADDGPDTGKVAASKLNIREAPSGHAEKVAKPLPRGKEIKILSTQDDWYEVSTEVRGWVHKDFIDTK